MIEYIAFVEDKAKNREELAKGVKGVKCTYVEWFDKAPLNNEVRLEVLNWIENQYQLFFNTVEAYENERLNIYVKEEGNPVAIGFLRISPNLDFSE